MAEKPIDMNREGPSGHCPEKAVTKADLRAWFIREVLPLEPMLMHFLQRNWRNRSDLEDFRQEIYENVIAAAELARPEQAKPFVFATARNLLINRLQRENIVPIEVMADLDALGVAAEEPGPERGALARDALRKLQAALDSLPPRSRQALLLKRVEGLSTREIATRMGISEQSVANHIARGVRVLAELVYGEPPGSRTEV
jgi:RNA polymerase sigma-70 factor (ECF subfamily)